MTKFFFNKNDRNNLELLPFGKFYLIFQMLILFINFYLFIFCHSEKKLHLNEIIIKLSQKTFKTFVFFLESRLCESGILTKGLMS